MPPRSWKRRFGADGNSVAWEQHWPWRTRSWVVEGAGNTRDRTVQPWSLLAEMKNRLRLQRGQHLYNSSCESNSPDETRRFAAENGRRRQVKLAIVPQLRSGGKS